MEPLKVYEATDNLIASMDGDGERAGYFEHLRALYPQELGAAAVNGAEELSASEPAEATEATEANDNGEAKGVHESPEAIERRECAARVKATLAEKYNRPESDFSVINSTNEAGENVCAVALTATERLDLGDSKMTYDPKRNWNKVIAKDNDPRFIIEVDGQKVDTRASQNMQWLKAIAAANPYINEWVWRTGEPEEADRDFAPVARLYDGQAGAGQFVRSDDDWNVSFRPVVVL